MNHGKIIPWALMVLLGACQGAVPANNQSSSEAPPPAKTISTESSMEDISTSSKAESATSATRALESAIKKDMTYVDFRKSAIADGWTPVVNSECNDNMRGQENICNQLPELEICSGDGYCNMHFTHKSKGKSVDVTTYGGYENWNVPGREAELYVHTWEFK